MKVGQILVPTDFTDTSTRALEYARALAAPLDATIHVLHVVAASNRRVRTGVAGLATVVGEPPVEIARYAKSHEIDLIVMGAHGRGPLSHMVRGSVTRQVVRDAPCPVLTVHHPDQHVEHPSRVA